MSDNFEQHVNRVKAERGKEWAERFEDEYQRFVNCVLIADAREIAGLSMAELSAATGVSRRVIARMEEHDMSVSDQAQITVSEYLKRLLLERCPPSHLESAGLGDLVATCRAAKQFTVNS